MKDKGEGIHRDCVFYSDQPVNITNVKFKVKQETRSKRLLFLIR